MGVVAALFIGLAVGAALGFWWSKHTAEAQTPSPSLDSVQAAAVLVGDDGRVQALSAGSKAVLGTSALGQPYDTLAAALPTQEHHGTAIIQASDRLYQPISLPQGGRRLVVFHDVTAWTKPTKRKAQIETRLDQMRRVYDEIGSTLNISAVLSLSLDMGARISGANAGCIILKDEDDGQFQIAQYIGPIHVEVVNTMLLQRTGLVGDVLTNGEPKRALNITDSTITTSPNPQAVMVLPLKDTMGEMVGLLILETQQQDRFTEETYQFVQLLSNRIAASVVNARLYDQVEAQLTRLKVTHAQITELEQLKTDMLRIAAHDLRDPLGAILLQLQLLERKHAPLDASLQRNVNNIRESAERMHRIVQDILSLERIEQLAGQNNSDADPINITEQAKLVISHLAHRADKKNLSLDFQNRLGEQAMVRGETTQLYEAMSNLVTNAIKYTPAGGQIEVELRGTDTEVVFEVRDTGYGIPADKQDRIFQPFFRVQSRETQHIDGTGLGLHLVRNIIMRHGGEMIFQSEEGKGSTFGFRLPLAVTP